MHPLSSSIRLLTTLFTAALIGGCSVPQRHPTVPTHDAYDSARARTAKLARRALQVTPTPGLSIVMVDGERTIMSDGFGVADGNTPVTADTRFRAGSLAKLFTATAILQLSETGRLDVGRPLRDYLPSFSVRRLTPAASPITLGALLSHQAGLPCDIDRGRWSSESFASATALLANEFTTTPPGYVTAYSNLGFDLLGEVVERVSGEPYAHYVTEQIFTPLAMLDSGFEVAPTRVAHGYLGGQSGPLVPIRDLPALGLVTSASDLGRYMQWLLSESDTVLSAAARHRMWHAVGNGLPLDLDARMGLAWSLEPGTLGYAGPVARHGGHTPRFSAELIVLPDQQLGVAVLANSGESRLVVRLLAEAALRFALEAKTGQPQPFQPKPPPTDSAPIPALAAGRYATELGVIRIVPETRRLVAETLGQSLPLVRYVDGTFGVESGAASGAADPRLQSLWNIRFSTRPVADRRLLITHSPQGQLRRFGVAIPEVPIPDRWRSLVGRYRVVNRDGRFGMDEFGLERRDDILYLRLHLPVADENVLLPIRPLNDSEAVILGFGRGGGEIVRADEKGGQPELHYSGYTARRSGNR